MEIHFNEINNILDMLSRSCSRSWLSGKLWRPLTEPGQWRQRLYVLTVATQLQGSWQPTMKCSLQQSLWHIFLWYMLYLCDNNSKCLRYMWILFFKLTPALIYINSYKIHVHIGLKSILGVGGPEFPDSYFRRNWALLCLVYPHCLFEYDNNAH